jgi:hypothetical protein
VRRPAPLLLVALLASAACSTAAPAPNPAAPASAAPAATPAPDPAAWAEGVCGSPAPFVALSQQQTPPTNPAESVEQLTTKATELDAAMEQALAALDQVGPSPVEDGDAFAPFATTPPDVDFDRFESSTELQGALEGSPSCEDVMPLMGA